MRKRSITIFLSVYAALCIAYGVGTSVIMPDNTDIIAAAGQENSSSKSSSTPVICEKCEKYVAGLFQKKVKKSRDTTLHKY